MKNVKTVLTSIIVALTFMTFQVEVKATSIADEFNDSFVNAIIEKYGITREEFTAEWASNQTELILTNKEITSIDKNGVPAGQHVLAQYFPNLEKLDLSGNSLGGIPNLPNKLKELKLANNKITALPNFTTVLEVLDVSNNEISLFPDFPTTLKELNASNNKLTDLPALPGNLAELNVSNNNLPGLPALPGGLTKLDVSDNNLPGLPEMPGNLIELNVSGNKLPGLPPLPSSLIKLDISDNEIPALLPLPEKLVELNVANNKLTKIPRLPETLKKLNVKGNENLTTIIGDLPAGLDIETDKELDYAKVFDAFELIIEKLGIEVNDYEELVEKLKAKYTEASVQEVLNTIAEIDKVEDIFTNQTILDELASSLIEKINALELIPEEPKNEEVNPGTGDTIIGSAVLGVISILGLGISLKTRKSN